MKKFESANLYSLLAPDDTDDAQSEESESSKVTDKVTDANGHSRCTKRKPDDESGEHPKQKKKQKSKSTNQPVPPASNATNTPTTSTTRPSQDDYFEKKIEENRLKHSLGQTPLNLGDSFNPFIKLKNPLSSIVKCCYRVYESIIKGSDKNLYECQGCTLFDQCDINIIRYHEKPLIPIHSKENKPKNRNSKPNFKQIENFGEPLDPSDLLKSYNGPSGINNNLKPRKNNGKL
ncbi:2831_t:CDS:1 [Racocetra fulgida]|uniref:2831_t:CDS:1 n=1 Tax=Racocetra fulgida TaxID=60492 RepID=A0A9N9BLN8_9GLOM|nr:2831_t:CDS:1 [Racocetra fulgida]